MQDLAHAVQRQIEHIIILEVAADVGHDKGRLAVLTLLGGVFRLFFGLRLLRLGLGGGQLFQLPLRLDLPYSPTHRGFQLVGVHRLEQIVAGPQMHRLMGILEQAVGCDEDDPAGRPLGQHGAGSVETAHARHLNIHQDEVRAPQHRRVSSFAAIFRHLQDHFPLKTALDQLRKRLPLQLFVIRDQQAYHRPNPPPKVLQGAGTS